MGVDYVDVVGDVVSRVISRFFLFFGEKLGRDFFGRGGVIFNSKI